MASRHYRIIAVVDPLPSGEELVRRTVAVLRGYNPRDVLWVTLCDDMGMGFESCHVPFLTPVEWLQRTEADLSSRLQELLGRLGITQPEFRLLSGPPNQTLAAVSEEWGSDLILSKETDAGKITGHNGMEWLQPPVPLACAVQTVAVPSPWQRGMQTLLHRWNSRLRPLFFPGRV